MNKRMVSIMVAIIAAFLASGSAFAQRGGGGGHSGGGGQPAAGIRRRRQRRQRRWHSGGSGGWHGGGGGYHGGGSGWHGGYNGWHGGYYAAAITGAAMAGDGTAPVSPPVSTSAVRSGGARGRITVTAMATRPIRRRIPTPSIRIRRCMTSTSTSRRHRRRRPTTSGTTAPSPRAITRTFRIAAARGCRWSRNTSRTRVRRTLPRSEPP